ncbi:MAG: FlgD immunoglobulin-like domain containing protein [bacterium]
MVNSTGVAVGTGGAVLNVSMRRAPALILTHSLQNPVTSQYDQWGWTNVHTQNWSTMYNGSLRLLAGTTVFDDGGRWDSVTNQFITRRRMRFDVAPGTYTIESQFSGYAPSSTTVYVGLAGLTVEMPAFVRKANISGSVGLPAGATNQYGTWISVNAVPKSTSTLNYGAWGGIWLNPGQSLGTYNIFGVNPGTYTIFGQLQGYSQSSTGPVTVASTDLTDVNIPLFGLGGAITGTITVTGNTSSFTRPSWAVTWPAPISVYVNVWSPQTFSNGWTQVFISTDLASASTTYLLTGLDRGTTYQMFANLDFNRQGSTEFIVPGGFPKNAYVPVGTSSGNLNFSFKMASGTIAGTILLSTAGLVGNDFTKVSMTGRILQSQNPYAAGRVFSVPDITVPCGAGGDCLPGYSSSTALGTATFRVEGLETQTMEVTFTYFKTGITRTSRVSVMSGSTTTVTVNLREQTYPIAGSIISQVTNPRFNTPSLMVQNSSFTFAAGYPAVPSGHLPIEAVRRTITKDGLVVAEGFDRNTTRVGYITQTGSYTITGLQEGVYLVRTLQLKECATCEVSVASLEKLVTVSSAGWNSGKVLADGIQVDTGSVNFTLLDGWNISGAVSLENAVQDVRNLELSVFNYRNEVVRSTRIALGSPGSPASSVNYSFPRLRAGGFYTMYVKDLPDASGGRARYAASPLKFPDRGTSPNGLQSDLSSQNLTLKQGAFIKGKLRDASSGSVITRSNVTILPPGFGCAAVSNPWVQGGYYVSVSSAYMVDSKPGPWPVDSDGTFWIGPVIPDITYDVRCEQPNWDAGYMRQGAQNFAPATVSGIAPSAGETKDLDILDLNPGQSLSGVVRSRQSSLPLTNIKVLAKPAYVENPITIQAMTDINGRYNLWVSTYISRYFDLTAAPRENNMVVAEGGSAYMQKMLLATDLTRVTTADFLLDALTGGVTGEVITVDGGALSYPFGSDKGLTAAAVFMQPYGVISSENPLGDIETITGPDGRFSIPGLSTGAYTMCVVSLGYSVSTATVMLTSTSTYDAGVTILQKGATLTGSIQKADPNAQGGFTSPSDDEVAAVAAANDDFTEFVFGSVETDAVSKMVERYTITGFKPGFVYALALLPKNGSDLVFPSEGSSVSFAVGESTAVKTVNLTFRPAVVDCSAVSRKVGNDQFQLKFNCSKAFRNMTTQDNDLSLIISTSALDSAGAALDSPDGTGYMLGSESRLFANRRQVTAVYRKAAGESRFSVRLKAYASAVDQTTGDNFLIDKVYDFYTGIASVATARVANMQGGSLELEAAEDEAENSRTEFEKGTFAMEGALNASATIQVTVGIRRADNLNAAQTQALYAGSSVDEVRALYADPKAFPAGMFEAMKALKEQKVGNYRTRAGANADVTPFSAFYDIFLPAGISHVLRQPARITLTYDADLSSGTDTDDLNVYYYNPDSQRYVLESADRSIDEENHTVSVSVDHLSVFVILAQDPVSNPQLYAGELKAYNFPNPFNNTRTKTKNTNKLVVSGGYDTTDPACTTQGTCIRVFVPPGVSGDMNLKIFNTAGELVKEEKLTGYTAGTTNVWPWDGKNSAGRQVASGVYIGEVKVGGKKAFFKMAVIKSSKYE